MCTLLTVSRGFYRANRKDILSRIRQDAVMNPHGFALEIIDTYPMFLQGFDVERAIDLIESSEFHRFVLHQRFSTTEYIELADCHGYVSVDGSRWYHNGIIDNTLGYRVDSQNLKDCLDVPEALQRFQGQYANIIRVLDNGSVEVGKAGASGQLHRDAKSHNFSTYPVGSIKIPVKPCEVFKISKRQIKKKRTNPYYWDSLSHWNKDYDSDEMDDIPASWIKDYVDALE